MVSVLCTWVLVAQGASVPAGKAVLRFPASEATQGVAVDDKAFYAVSNSAIGKYNRFTGKKLAEWRGPANGPIIHLDSGVVRGGRLYCAHSNFPATPMESSIEVWDAKTLRHVESISFGLSAGSATWIDWHRGHWYVAFAHYNGKGGEPGRTNNHTRLVQYDTEFRPRQSWTYPKEVVDRWDGMSNSGGIFGPDGMLYASPHHAPEVYVLRLPRMGTTLELVRTIPVEMEGQGIARDPLVRNGLRLWGIQRRTREVLAVDIAAER